MHENRLKGLYVEPNAEAVVPPIDNISTESLDTLLGLAKSRMAIERPIHDGQLDLADLELFNWLDTACDDPVRRKAIFGAGSMAKLSEPSTPKTWGDSISAPCCHDATGYFRFPGVLTGGPEEIDILFGSAFGSAELRHEWAPVQVSTATSVNQECRDVHYELGAVKPSP